MKRLNQDLDYTLYKIYIWGGLPLLVIYIFAVTLVLDRRNLLGPSIGPYIIVPLVLWLGGILLYWWWVFLVKGNRELQDLAESPTGDVPGIKSLKSWNTLCEAMSISGGNPKELVKNAKRANRPIILWFGSVNLLACWILGPIFLGTLGLVAEDVTHVQGSVWLGGIFFGIVLQLVVTYFVLGWGGGAPEKSYLAPLGLAETRAPRLTADRIGPLCGGQALVLDGSAIFEGERYGRLVHIETIGRRCLTVVRVNTPEFSAQSNDGKLVPDKGAPEAVVHGLQSLRKAKRWQGITVHAGPEGVAIQRHSKGTNMWLYDLWLAEYLISRPELMITSLPPMNRAATQLPVRR